MPVDDTTPQPRFTPAYSPTPEPQAYPPIQPVPVAQLPDYKPRGMSNIDKTFIWLFASVILVFSLTFAARYLNVHIQPASQPKATATAATAAHKKTGKGCNS